MQLKFRKMPMNGLVKMMSNTKVVGCHDQNTLVCTEIDIGEYGQEVTRSFATITNGAKIDGICEYIGPVPNSDLHLFELKGGAYVIR